MEEINLKDGINLIKKYNKMSPKERDQIKRQRFYAMVTFARKHNKLYSELYKNLGVNFFMRDVPYVERSFLMEHKDIWLSDEIIASSIPQAINTVRSFSFERDYHRFLLHKSRYVIISSSDGSLQRCSWDKSTTVLSVFLPTDELVRQLNELNPAFLWAFPSTLDNLLMYKKSGSLKIKPVLIIAGGEALNDDLRAALINEFDCTVQSTYSSAEFGIVASECQMGHLHVNDDWIILEQADANGHPVKEGQKPEKILITNLYKTDYPIIRMTLPDNIRFHNKTCPCGNTSPWISITAAKDDYILFKTDEKQISIHSDEFSSVLNGIDGLLRYQIVLYANNNISLRMEVSNESMRGIIFLQAEQTLRRFLKEKGVIASAITMDADTPVRNELNGKLKNVLDHRE